MCVYRYELSNMKRQTAQLENGWRAEERFIDDTQWTSIKSQNAEKSSQCSLGLSSEGSLVAIYWRRDHNTWRNSNSTLSVLPGLVLVSAAQTNSYQRGFLDLANELCWPFNSSRLSTSWGLQPNLHKQMGARMWASAWANLLFCSLKHALILYQSLNFPGSGTARIWN